MWGCLFLLLAVGFLGNLLSAPLTVSDLMAAQSPAQYPAPWEWAVLASVPAVTALAVTWSAGRRRPGRAPALAVGTVLLLALCAVVTLWVRDRVGTDNPTLAGTLQSLAAGVTAPVFRGVVRRRERGRPLPGEVWLAMVPFRDGDQEARHYCVVLKRRPGYAEVLQITSQDKDGRPGYAFMPNGEWDTVSGRGHWVETAARPRRVPYRNFLKDRPQGPCPTGTWRQLRRRSAARLPPVGRGGPRPPRGPEPRTRRKGRRAQPPRARA
ncbi:hypothetical protein [Streptomyces somaliensis]|uniref:Uncharacterized protein n=1 Tax=Streptomyces somaliensis (strain ATCC 33201 / DSM 40738 / JCM 12659 / KCTC 9044 / NCTC 11332 / NRRL B-12077 / IP 733) TaxID=1134445 RepID=A0AA44DFU5_STRE0|nr:hypothetical protein [Streptomyces somaliensis]NKY16186.1 hypothetical protein [Streptomyces somaliensis DSM 40738]